MFDQFNEAWMRYLPKKVIQNTEGNLLDAYLIALEGYRRGFDLTWYRESHQYDKQTQEIKFSLSDKEKEYHFTKVSREKIENVFKDNTQDQLEIKWHQSSVIKDFDLLKSKIKTTNYPVFIQTENNNVIIIKSDKDFNDYIGSFTHKSLEHPLLVKRLLKGDYFKIYIINGKIVGALKLDEENNISSFKTIDIEEIPSTIREKIKKLNALNNDVIYGCIDLFFNVQYKTKDVKRTCINIDPYGSVRPFLSSATHQLLQVNIIDDLFPNTKEVNKQHRMYFNLEEIIKPLQMGVANSFKINLPRYKSEVCSKKIIIKDIKSNLHMIQWIREKALQLQIYGSLFLKENGDTELIVIGEAENFKIFTDKLLNIEQGSKDLQVRITEWDGPVNVGFIIKDLRSIVEEQISLINEDIKEMEKEHRRLDATHRKMLESMSWTLTAPIRIISAVLKRIKSKS